MLTNIGDTISLWVIDMGYIGKQIIMSCKWATCSFLLRFLLSLLVELLSEHRSSDS